MRKQSMAGRGTMKSPIAPGRVINLRTRDQYCSRRILADCLFNFAAITASTPSLSNLSEKL